MTATIDPFLADPLPRGLPGAPLEGAVARALRHAVDVDRLLHVEAVRWTDALVSETRAHLAGCLNAIEMGLGLALAPGWLARPVEALGPGYCREAIERHPGLLSSLLLQHLRQRAAVAVVLRLTVERPANFADIADEIPETGDGAPTAEIETALTALRLSLDPWLAAHPVDRPMRADLAAEAYCELVWIATALLVGGLAEQMGVEALASAPALARAAEIVIARHDEGTGPFARAAYAATLVSNDGALDRQAAAAVVRRDLLLLASLGARRCGTSQSLALALLIDGDDDERAAFARALGLPVGGYVGLIEGLAPVLGDAGDGALPGLVDRYRLLTAEEVDARLSPWRGPEPLARRLAQMTGMGRR